MNITEDYLKNYDDEIYTDDKFIQFHKNEKTHNIVFNTIERDLTHESMSNFRLKFDANGIQSKKIPIFLNSNINITGTANVNGFTFEGISYLPYNPNQFSGEIVGYYMKDYDSESGILIQKRFPEIKEIKKIRIEIPKIMLPTHPSFLYIHFNELTGFSKTYLPNGKAITFCAYSGDFHTDHYIFETRHSLHFDSFNLQTLSFDISFPKTSFLKDYANIYYAQINNSSNIELIASMPSTFAIGDSVIFEPDTEIIVNIDNIPHNVLVIDGYIDDSTVILRTFEGKLIGSSKTINGLTNITFGNNTFLIATASGGTDTSIYENYNIYMKSLVFPYSIDDINITPITTILTDYIIYQHKKSNLSIPSVRKIIDSFETKYGVIDSFSDFIKQDNLHTGYLSYQIVSTLKVTHFLLTQMSKNIVNPSKVSLGLSQFMMDKNDFDFTNKTDITNFIIKISNEYNINTQKYYKSIYNAIESLVNHNYIDENLQSFDTFSKSALVLHKDMELNRYAKYNIFSRIFSKEELTKRRIEIIPSNENTNIRNREAGEITPIYYEGTNEFLEEQVDTVRKILRNVIFEFNVKYEKHCLKDIEIIEYDDVSYIFGKLDKIYNTIYLNKNFNINLIEGSFKLNSNPINVLINFVLQCINSILCKTDFKFKQNVIINDSFFNHYEQICIINNQSVFIDENEIEEDDYINDIIIKDNEQYIIDFKKSETLALKFKDCNAPISNNIVSCDDLNLKLNEDHSLECNIFISKSKSTGKINCNCILLIDNQQKEEIILSIKVGKRNTNKTLKFRDKIQTTFKDIKVIFTFYFENNKNNEQIVFAEYNLNNITNLHQLHKIHNENTMNLNNKNIFEQNEFETNDDLEEIINPLSSSLPLDSSGNIDYSTLDLTMKSEYIITNLTTDSSGNDLIELNHQVDSAFIGTELLVTHKSRINNIKLFNTKLQSDFSIEIIT